MSKHGRQMMAVRPQELQTPELGMTLTDRGPAVVIKADFRAPEEKEAEEPTLAERLERARRVEPAGKDLHCRDCFNRGRDAAVRVIEGE